MNNKKYRHFTISQYEKQGVSKHEIKTIINGTASTLNDGNFSASGIVNKGNQRIMQRYVPLNHVTTEFISVSGRNVLAFFGCILVLLFLGGLGYGAYLAITNFSPPSSVTKVGSENQLRNSLKNKDVKKIEIVKDVDITSDLIIEGSKSVVLTDRHTITVFQDCTLITIGNINESKASAINVYGVLNIKGKVNVSDIVAFENANVIINEAADLSINTLINASDENAKITPTSYANLINISPASKGILSLNFFTEDPFELSADLRFLSGVEFGPNFSTDSEFIVSDTVRNIYLKTIFPTFKNNTFTWNPVYDSHIFVYNIASFTNMVGDNNTTNVNFTNKDNVKSISFFGNHVFAENQIRAFDYLSGLMNFEVYNEVHIDNGARFNFDRPNSHLILKENARFVLKEGTSEVNHTKLSLTYENSEIIVERGAALIFEGWTDLDLGEYGCIKTYAIDAIYILGTPLMSNLFIMGTGTIDGSHLDLPNKNSLHRGSFANDTNLIDILTVQYYITVPAHISITEVYTGEFSFGTLTTPTDHDVKCNLNPIFAGA